MLCHQRPEAALDPCETCPSCTMVLAGTHPDLDVVSKPADKSFLPLDLFLGDREHRRQEGLCHNISLKPFMGGRKIAVIDDADYLNAEGANCLLKTLEEPPPQSVLILIGTSPAKQLPTIRSRCQLVRFQPLAAEMVAEILLSKGLAADAAEARRLAAACRGEHPAGGRVGRSRRSGRSAPRSTSAWRPRYWRACDWRRRCRPSSRRPARRPPPGGPRLRQVVGFAATYYEGLLKVQSGGAPPDDPELRRFLDEAINHSLGGARRLPRDWTVVWTRWKRSTATPIKRR